MLKPRQSLINILTEISEGRKTSCFSPKCCQPISSLLRGPCLCQLLTWFSVVTLCFPRSFCVVCLEFLKRCVIFLLLFVYSHMYSQRYELMDIYIYSLSYKPIPLLFSYSSRSTFGLWEHLGVFPCRFGMPHPFFKTLSYLLAGLDDLCTSSIFPVST